MFESQKQFFEMQLERAKPITTDVKSRTLAIKQNLMEKLKEMDLKEAAEKLKKRKKVNETAIK